MHGKWALSGVLTEKLHFYNNENVFFNWETDSFTLGKGLGALKQRWFKKNLVLVYTKTKVMLVM